MANIKSGQVGQDLKQSWGTSTTVTASDTIDTGLKGLHCVLVSFATDPADANLFVSAVIVGATSGKFTLKTWKTADGTDPTPVAASAFGKVVNWVAFGV